MSATFGRKARRNRKCRILSVLLLLCSSARTTRRRRPSTFASSSIYLLDELFHSIIPVLAIGYIPRGDFLTIPFIFTRFLQSSPVVFHSVHHPRVLVFNPSPPAPICLAIYSRVCSVLVFAPSHPPPTPSDASFESSFFAAQLDPQRIRRLGCMCVRFGPRYTRRRASPSLEIDRSTWGCFSPRAVVAILAPLPRSTRELSSPYI